MPRGPKGERRPRDVTGNAVRVMRIATGQITDDVPPPEDEGQGPRRRRARLERREGQSRSCKRQEASGDRA
jgi:hypothetical protein